LRQRYTAVAPLYDALSAEWPVYRAGRVRGIPLLRLSEGNSVLDVGCGTGLNFPLLLDAVGPRGQVLGVDTSRDMLRTARRRLGRPPPPNVHLIERDATRLGDLASEVAPLVGRGPDAILFTYALSLMKPWQAAWDGATALARPGTRIVIVDMALPTGRGRLLAPLARMACAVGGADIAAHPWTRLAVECADITHLSARGGHVQIWAGTWTRLRLTRVAPSPTSSAETGKKVVVVASRHRGGTARPVPAPQVASGRQACAMVSWWSGDAPLTQVRMRLEPWSLLLEMMRG